MNLLHTLVTYLGGLLVVFSMGSLTESLAGGEFIWIFLGGYITGFLIEKFLSIMDSLEPEARDDEWEANNL